jgi:hypothetical protein
MVNRASLSHFGVDRCRVPKPEDSIERIGQAMSEAKSEHFGLSTRELGAPMLHERVSGRVSS